MSHSGRGKGPGHSPSRLAFSYLCFSRCGSTPDVQAIARVTEASLSNTAASSRAVFFVVVGAGGGQRWVRQILCTTKARSLLVWRMADSPGCVDKLLITTNGNIIHLSLINSYFWETNKQKVICPQQDDIHSSAATSWHLGSWSLISTKGCGYDPQPVCLCWFSLATPASLCSPKDVAVTLKLFVGASELVGPVMNWWLCPGCTPTATHLAQAPASSAQQVVMGKWMGGSMSWRCCNFFRVTAK